MDIYCVQLRALFLRRSFSLKETMEQFDQSFATRYSYKNGINITHTPDIL